LRKPGGDWTAGHAQARIKLCTLDIFKAKDGRFITQVIVLPMFRRWTQRAGWPQMLEDRRFANVKLRGDSGKFLSDLMSEWCNNLPMAEALA
jgi:crotonobetainyl-CoA:carnitine CoA-transferase CaiB-like acyl-CoA transferase